MSVDITLTNEIRVPRSREWLCRGLPFPQETLNDVEALRVRDEGGRELPLGTKELARWPDGSLKWVLLQFPVSFYIYPLRPAGSQVPFDVFKSSFDRSALLYEFYISQGILELFQFCLGPFMPCFRVFILIIVSIFIVTKSISRLRILYPGYS